MSEAVHNQLPLWLDPRRREDAPVDLGTLKAELARLESTAGAGASTLTTETHCFPH